MSQEALVLFAHGARDPAWAEPFRRMLARVHASRPELRAELAFLECMEPTLSAAISRLAGEGATRVTIVPLFLAQGGHLRQDLPRLVAAVRRDFPALALHVTDAIGDSGELTDAIADWALSRHESRS